MILIPKLQKNPKLSVLYNDPEIVNVFPQEKTSSSENLEGAISFLEEQAQITRAKELITLEQLVKDLKNLQTNLCEEEFGITNEVSSSITITNPMAKNKFIDGIESNIENHRKIAENFLNNLKDDEFKQIIKYCDTSQNITFDVEKFLQIYNESITEKIVNGLFNVGSSVLKTQFFSQMITGKLLGKDYSGSIFLDTIYAIQFLLKFFKTTGYGKTPALHMLREEAGGF